MKLNLGSNNKRVTGFTNVDRVKLPNVDIVADLSKKFPFNNNSIEEILAEDILEHMIDPIYFLKECNRVLVKGGKIKLHVPHYKDNGAYRPQHKHYFSYTWFTSGLKENFIDAGKWKINARLAYKKGMITPLDLIANIHAPMWERLFWVTSIDVELTKE